MSSVSTYYVAVNTGLDYSLDTYDAAAGTLVNLLEQILSSRTTVASLTGTNPTNVTSEIEVGLEGKPRELVGKAVVDVLAPTKVKFDKNRFSKLVKANPAADAWPQLKISKRQVQPELSPAQSSSSEYEPRGDGD
jgi:hypothetical protein